MRILMAHEDTRPPGQGGGAETLCRTLLQSLAMRGHEVAWWYGERPFEDALAAHRPDVVHFQTLHTRLGFASVRFCQDNGVPHVWALMDYWPFCLPRMLLRDGVTPCTAALGGVCDGECQQGRAARGLVPLVNRSPVVALNEHTAAIYRRHGLRVDAVTPLGVDAAFWDTGRTDWPGQVVASSAWPHMPTKGMHILNAASHALRIKSWIISGQPHRNLRAGLDRGGIYVFPSVYQETWGLSLTEAMANGLACVASDVAGPRAQITDGVNGRLFPGGDTAALTEILADLLGDPTERERLGRAAREWVQGHATLDHMAAHFEAAYEGVLHGVT